MNYGLGTYRGATKSLAVELGAEHEPITQLGEEATRFVHFPHDGKNRAILLDRLRHRRETWFNGIVDAAQAYVIPLILEVDPHARFHWIVRNPFEVVASLVYASAVWKKHDASEGRKLIYPKLGWPEGTTRIEKAAYYWNTTHTLIRRAFTTDSRTNRAHVTTYTPEKLKQHTNQHGREGHRRFSPRHAAFVAERCWPLWQEIN